MSNWKPISEAPQTLKDNRERLLGIVDGIVRVIQWGKTSHVPMYGWNLADQGAEDYELCKPTHFMNLPKPPIEEEK